MYRNTLRFSLDIIVMCYDNHFMSKTTIYKTENESWGFYGTTIKNYGISNDDTDILFNEAAFLANKLLDFENPVKFLDSAIGRHIADELNFYTKQSSLENLINAVKTTFETDRKMWKKWGKQVI